MSLAEEIGFLAAIVGLLIFVEGGVTFLVGRLIALFPGIIGKLRLTERDLESICKMASGAIILTLGIVRLVDVS